MIRQMKREQKELKILNFDRREIAFTEAVISRVCHLYAISPKELIKKRRFTTLVQARHALYYVLKKRSTFSDAKIGQCLHPVLIGIRKKDFYTKEERDIFCVVDPSTVSVSLSKTDHLLEHYNKSNSLSNVDKKLGDSIYTLLEDFQEFSSTERVPKIGSTCLIKYERGVVTNIYDSHYRVLFEDSSEGKYSKHVVKIL